MPILLAIVSVLLLAAVFGPQWWVRHVLAKYGEDRSDLPGTGAELARHLLDEAGLQQVKVEPSDLGDHYDPDALAVRLTPPHHDGRSIAAVWAAISSAVIRNVRGTCRTPMAAGAWAGAIVSASCSTPRMRLA